MFHYYLSPIVLETCPSICKIVCASVINILSLCFRKSIFDYSKAAKANNSVAFVIRTFHHLLTAMAVIWCFPNFKHMFYEQELFGFLKLMHTLLKNPRFNSVCMCVCVCICICQPFPSSFTLSFGRQVL